MRIGIDATCWANARGYGRYTRGLITAVLDDPGDDTYTLFADAHTARVCTLPTNAEIVIVPTRDAQTSAADGSRRPADMLAMGAAVSRHALDVLFYPSVYTYFPVWTRAVKIVGIHDVIPERLPQLVFPDPKARLLWTLKSRIARWQADALLTVSDYARDGLIQIFGWKADDIYIVGEAPDEVFRPITDRALIESAMAAHDLPPDARYVMFLGGMNPHKNLGVLLEAVAVLRTEPEFADLHLVLVGPAETDLFTPNAGRIREQAHALQLGGAIHITGYLSDEEIVRLLNSAVALVLPSLEEGYGLPGVEAAACGTPVIATTRSPLPALLEGGGSFFDPQDVGALQDALKSLLRDRVKRDHMGRMALKRATLLTWARAADEFRAMMRGVETRYKKRIQA